MGWLFLINCYNGHFYEILIINIPYFLDIILTHLYMIKKKKNIFERHNNFIFQQIYFILGKNRFKHNICYVGINLVSLSFLILTNYISSFYVLILYLMIVIIFYTYIRVINENKSIQ